MTPVGGMRDGDRAFGRDRARMPARQAVDIEPSTWPGSRKGLTPQVVMLLQRQAGNAAVVTLIEDDGAAGLVNGDGDRSSHQPSLQRDVLSRPTTRRATPGRAE